MYFKCATELEEYIKTHLEALKEGKTDNMFTEKRLAGGKNKKKTIDKKTKKRDIWLWLCCYLILVCIVS